MAGIGSTSTGTLGIDLNAKQFGLVVAEWHATITDLLFEGALHALIGLGVEKKNITRKNVPGSYELVLGADYMAKSKKIDAVICLGCIVQGDTPHFDYICQAVANGLIKVSLSNKKPVSFGVLTVMNIEQAWQRAGGSLGNKGEEAALAAVKMFQH